MDLPTLLIFAGALTVAAGSPGPSTAALSARVIARGARSALPFMSAMWVGEAVWLGAAVAGLSAVAEAFAGAFFVVKIAGVLYLLHLAWKMWTAPVEADERASEKPKDGWSLFLSGLAVTLGNPKIMAFYMALLPSIVELGGVTVLGWAELTLTMLTVLIAVDVAWMLAANRARRVLRSPRAMKIANRVSAGVMGGAAAAIAAR